MVMFSDFQCPFCSRVEPTLEADREGVPGKVRVVVEELPAALPPERQAGRRGRAGRRRAGQVLGDARQAVREPAGARRASLEKYAQELGLDMAKFKAALDANKYKAQIEAEMKAGRPSASTARRPSSSTAARSSGAYPYDTFKKIVDQELAKKEGGSTVATKKVAAATEG